MKPPLWRQDRSVYPYVFQIQTRHRDEDHLNHINNVAIAEYYDEARHSMMRQVRAKLDEAERVRIVTADSRVTYLGEAFHPDMLDIGCGLLRIGTASMEIGQAMFQNGRCVGVCATVFVQATADGAQPLRPNLRASLERFLIRAPAQ